MDNWHVITPSAFAHEIDALEFVKGGLGAQCHAFANFTFIGLDGSLNEVDLLVIGPWGVFLCEIKSRTGTIRGDMQTWQWVDGSRVHSDDNPLLLAQRKCQKLKALLFKQKAFRDKQPPFLEPVIFLSHISNRLELPKEAGARVFLRDTSGRPGILAAFNRREGEGLKPFDHPPVNAPLLKAVLQAMQQAGFKAKTGSRRVGDYELGKLLYESPEHTVQDWEASHASAKSGIRLARLYLVQAAATVEDRERLTKAARRDFELMEPLDHPGLLRVETMVSTERGPVVIYRYPKDARRLDHFLAEKGESLTVTDRLSLLRQIAEAVAYAHDHRVIHRGLTPQSILVSPVEGGGIRSHIYNWQFGSGQFTGTAGACTRSLHATGLLEQASTAYLAPEAIAGMGLDSPEVDCFSLGALAFRLFTDQPPAHSCLELATILREGPGYLDVAAVKDGMPASLCDLVTYSAHREAALRYSARDFAQHLTEVEEELTRPEPQHVADPREARAGDTLEGGLQVIRRLGSGSVSIVLLVRAPQEKEPWVLKLAAKPDYNERLETEFEALGKLAHPGIVKAHRLFKSGGVTGILMDCAVEVPKEWISTESPGKPPEPESVPDGKRGRFSEPETLAVRLRRYGRLEIDLLQSFGADLLKALSYIHECGLAHRDVKPDNIGLRLPRSKERVRLILFDFSLVNAPLDEIRVGTPPYIDPFLALRRIKRWDSHAERFSAAMTLYEMASGALPKWGDGQSAPHLLDAEVTLQPELFIPDLRARLAAFFTRALRRDYRQRFDTWDQMQQEWAEIFRHVDDPVIPVRPPTENAPAPESKELIAQSTRDTQLIQLGLSARTFNALDRLQLVTVDDLLRYPLRQIYRMPGVGNKTRLELAELVRDLRRHFSLSDTEAATPAAAALEAAAAGEGAVSGAEAADAGSQSIDGIARQLLLRKATGKGGPETGILERFMGADTSGTDWISQSDIAPLCGVTRARVGQVVEKARERWARLPALTALRQEVERILRSQSGVMTHRELFSAVLATRGSTFGEPERSAVASMVVRAAVETEKALESPRFMEVRRGDQVLIALDRPFAAWAAALGAAADELLRDSGETLPSRSRAVEVLQAVPRPVPEEGREECAAPDSARLVALAASLAVTARANARLELYPAGLAPLRSLLLCRSSFFHTGPLGVEDLARRVASRFPQAEPLPADRAALEPLLREADIPLEWSPAARQGRGAFVNAVEAEGGISQSEDGTRRQRTLTRAPLPAAPSMPEDVATALLLEEKLLSSATRGSFLVLSVPPARLARAEAELLARFPVDRVDGDALFLRLLREAAAEWEIEWSTILQADAALADSDDGQKMRHLMATLRPGLREALISPLRTLLLVNPGLFARYGLMGLLAELRNDIGRAGGPHGLWTLIPAVVESALPRLNGQPVPVISDSQHLVLPDAWLDNVHRSGGAPTG